jgi:hypothetical protein
VNWQHLTAFVWLRWRLVANQWRRAGALNAVLTTIVAVGALATSVPLFFGCFLLGMYLVPKATAAHLLYVWDGLIVSFLFCWMIGLLTDLQRAESLSLSKFLHLPVSVKGAFLINYISSLLRLSLIVFVPAMAGAALALVFSRVWLALVALALLAAFLLMVTGLTYQFQGWLASLMSNPRRRRTVVAVMTMAFVLITQLPNLLNFVRPWRIHEKAAESSKLSQELKELNRAAQAHEFDAAEHLRRQNEAIERHKLAAQKADAESLRTMEETVRLANLVLPVGWLPLGIATAAEGQFMLPLLGCLGMALIGTASLWSAYRTTVRIYQDGFTTGKPRPASEVRQRPASRKSDVLLLERRLPRLSEPVSAVALGSLRSLLRSPEAKMMLLTPLILGAVFGSILFQAQRTIPELIRPLLAIGGMFVVLFGVMQIMANQFGFDRDGFRVFVLCSASRRDILLGKNLAFAPPTLGMGAGLLIFLQALCPLRADHFLAMIPQFVSMFLLFSLLANLLSIYAPMHIAAGSLKPSNQKLVPVLMQMGMFTVLFPLTQAPTLVPLGIEAALTYAGFVERAPICLVLSLVECAAVVWVYRLGLRWQGELFQAREQKILDVVTNRAA